MKKTTLNLVATFVSVLFGLDVKAQRYADLKVEFVTPLPNTVFYAPTIIHYTFKVINQGPDTIFSTDTIKFKPGHLFWVPDKLRKRSIEKIIIPGDSFLISDTISVNGRLDRDDFYLSFAYTPQTYGPDKGHGTLANEFWEDRHDNLPKVNLIHKKATSGIQNIVNESVVLFPNPILQGGWFNVKTDVEPSSITVFSPLGTTIETMHNRIGKVTNVKLNTEYSGLAFVQVEIDNQVQIFHVLIQ